MNDDDDAPHQLLKMWPKTRHQFSSRNAKRSSVVGPTDNLDQCVVAMSYGSEEKMKSVGWLTSWSIRRTCGHGRAALSVPRPIF
jgi:hypothetical protein